MDPKKIITTLPLVFGAVCILVALTGGVMQLVQEEETPSSVVQKARTAPAAVQKAPEEKAIAEKEPEPVKEREEMSDAERKKQTTRILLDRIAQTPEELNLEWFGSVCQYIRDDASLQSYLAPFFNQGAQAAAEYEAEQRRMKKAISTDPRYFMSLAKKELYGNKLTARGLEKYCKENLALTLYREREEKGGVEYMDETLTSSFFKELGVMYQLRRQLAEKDGEDSQVWLKEQFKALEGAAVDRYLRIEFREELVRQKKSGTQTSAAPELIRKDILTKSLNEQLLMLGNLYLEAAEQEANGREQMQFYAEHAFAILAMVYQRTHSGDSLSGIRKINEIQRQYLQRMAHVSWKRAQLAVAAKDRDAAAEHYFRATQRYNECMAKAVGPDKEKIAEEFILLKREIAAWKKGEREGVEGEAAGI